MQVGSAKNGDCQPIFVAHKRRVSNQSGHENRWLYPIFRAHCTSAKGCQGAWPASGRGLGSMFHFRLLPVGLPGLPGCAMPCCVTPCDSGQRDLLILAAGRVPAPVVFCFPWVPFYRLREIESPDGALTEKIIPGNIVATGSQPVPAVSTFAGTSPTTTTEPWTEVQGCRGRKSRVT